jgi:hypothetical protein
MRTQQHETIIEADDPRLDHVIVTLSRERLIRQRLIFGELAASLSVGSCDHRAALSAAVRVEHDDDSNRCPTTLY